MADVGITITVNDKTGPGTKSAKEGADSVGKKYEAVGKVSGGLGLKMIALNQALGLAKRAWAVVSQAVGGAIRSMLELRGPNDQITRQFLELERNAKQFRAEVGNILTPIILGVSDAWKSTGVSAMAYIQTNKRMIATNIVTFLADTARVLIQGVGAGAILVSKSVSGLIQLWNLLKLGVNEALGAMTSGVAGALRGMAKLAEFAGRGGLAKSLVDVADNVDLLAETFSESADASSAAIDEEIRKQEELQKTIGGVVDIAMKFTGEAEAAALDRIAKGWTNVGNGIRHTTKAQDQFWIDSMEKMSDHYTRLADFQEADAKRTESLDQQRAESLASMVSQIGDAWTQVVLAGIQNTEHLGRAMISAVIDTALITINSYAAMAAARAFAAQQDFPIVGVALGLAAAAAASAIVKGFLNNVPKAATGGIFSRPTIAQIGEAGPERVLSTAQTRAFDRLVAAAERGGGGSQISISFAPRIDQIEKGTREDRKKMLLSLARDFEDLVDKGLMLRNLKRA